MFERSTVAPPRVDDDPVIVWTEGERPVRLVYRLARWRVEGEPEPLREVPESLYHPLITHPTERTAGWRCRVRSADSRRTLVLALRRDGALWRAEELPE